MKKIFFVFVSITVLVFISAALWAEGKTLSQIYLYKGGEVAGTGMVGAGPEGQWTGPGFSMIKLAVGESIVITAKGADEDGKEVAIWPTFKADRELSVTPVVGKSRSVMVKALKEAPLSYLTAIVVTEEGKKITVDGAFQIK